MLDKIKKLKSTREQLRISKEFTDLLKNAESFEEFKTNYKVWIFKIARDQLIATQTEEEIHKTIDESVDRVQESLKTMFSYRHLLNPDKGEKQ